MSENNVHQHLQNTKTWKQVGLIILFGIIYFFAQYLIFALVIIQTLFKGFTGKAQPVLAEFCSDVTEFVSRILRYSMWISSEMPYPVNGSPSGISASSDDDRSTSVPSSVGGVKEETAFYDGVKRVSLRLNKSHLAVTRFSEQA